MRGLMISELIQELSTMLEEQCDMPVMIGIKVEEKKEILLDVAQEVNIENVNDIYYCEIS